MLVYVDENGKWHPLAEEIVRCKDCKHRPTKPDDYENGFDLEFPDGKCPCQCDDGWYSWYPPDEWFCANGVAKDINVRDKVDWKKELVPYDMKWNPDCEDCLPEGIDDCIECHKRMEGR